MADPDPTITDLMLLIASTARKTDTVIDGNVMWLSGKLDDPDSFDKDGGRMGALGYYPQVDVNGGVTYAPCLARIAAIALGGANAETLAALTQSVSEKIAAIEASKQATDTARASTIQATQGATAATAAAQQKVDQIGDIGLAVAASKAAAAQVTGIGISAVRSRSGWLGARINGKTGRIFSGDRAAGGRFQSGVTRQALDPDLVAVIPSPLRRRSGWLDGRMNAKTGRMLSGVRSSGVALIGTVSRQALDPALAALVPFTVRPRSGWLGDVAVNNRGRVSRGKRADGTDLAIAPAIGESNLAPLLKKRMFKERATVRAVKPDGMQSIEQGTGVLTHPGGYIWTRLPMIEDPRYIRNATAGGSATALQIRRRLPVNMAGARLMGDWSPAASGAASITRVGTISNTTGYGYINYSSQGIPAASTKAEGDYYVVHPIGGGTVDLGNISLGIAYPGDLVVVSGGAWVLQRAPAGTAGPGVVFERDWWNVTAAGTFDGVSFAPGDRVTLFGGTYYHRYRRGRPDQGEVFNRGLIDASAGAAPASPIAGDAWQVSGAGTIAGVVLAVDDWLLYDGAAFYGVSGAPITSIAAGRPFLLAIDGDLSDYEVRRADKGATRAAVRLLAPIQPTIRAETAAVFAIGDSMVHFIRTALLAAFSDRAATVEGFDSAGSGEIASLFEHWARTGNVFAGRTVVSWVGQNTEDQWQDTIEAHLRMQRLCAAFDRYYLPVTPAGRREFTFNGTRLVGRWQEPMKIGTDTSNGLVATQREVARLFAGRYVDARAAIVAAVAANPTLFAVPDLQFPGMTEAQTAAAYGLIPLSVYYSLAGKGVTAGAAIFKGYHSAAALPTDGADGDYYLRSVATSGTYVGNLIVRIASTWTELDIGNRNTVVHFGGGPQSAWANTALSAAIRTFFDTHGW